MNIFGTQNASATKSTSTSATASATTTFENVLPVGTRVKTFEIKGSQNGPLFGSRNGPQISPKLIDFGTSKCT